MNYLEATQEIAEVIPDLQSKSKEIKNSYDLIITFTNSIKMMIQNNDNPILLKSLKKMNLLYKNGDYLLRSVIENSFIYSLDSCTSFCSMSDRNNILKTLSPDLKNVYAKQIYSHGI